MIVNLPARNHLGLRPRSFLASLYFSVKKKACECKHSGFFFPAPCSLCSADRLPCSADLHPRSADLPARNHLGLRPRSFLAFLYFSVKKKACECKHSGFFFAEKCKSAYLLENCGARRAFFKPYFFLSFIRGSRVKKPSFFSAGRLSASTSKSALAIPCRIAPA